MSSNYPTKLIISFAHYAKQFQYITLQSILKTPKTRALWKWYHKGSHFKIRANFYQVPISFSVTIYSNSMELKSMQQHSQNNSTVLVFQKYPPEVINSSVTPYNHLSHQSKKAKNKNIFVCSTKSLLMAQALAYGAQCTMGWKRFLVNITIL